MIDSTSTSPSPHLERDELAAWKGFLRTHAKLVRALDARLNRQHGLSLSAYDVLAQLAQAPGRRMRMSELADAVVLSPSGLTRLVDRLTREGLVARQRCPSDARGAFAVLSPEGRERYLAARATHLEDVHKLFLSHLGPAELELLADLSHRVDGEPSA